MVKNINMKDSGRAWVVRQRQKEYCAVKVHAVGGDLASGELKKVSEVAEKYGNGEIHLTTRQAIEIPFVRHEHLDTVRRELESAGLTMGVGGPRVRVIAACPGSSICRFGIIDTKEIARHLDRTYFGQDTPYKFKMAVTGCPHNCAKATENDIGIMGGIEPAWDESSCNDCRRCESSCPKQAISRVDGNYLIDLSKCFNCSICTSSCPTDAWKVVRQGYVLWLGGTAGKAPRFATKVPGLIESGEKLYHFIDNAVEWYRKYGRKKERFGHTIDRIGLESALETITDGGGK